MEDPKTLDRSQRVERLFNSARHLPDAEREIFLATACAGDWALRAEVERLIASYKQAGSFLESPAIELVARQLAETEPSPVGLTLNQYKILAPLGHGGMGEVYRATDTKLGRAVAIKIFRASFADDEMMLRRFWQEARAASALNHPNILTVHDYGEVDSTRFIATELIEGVTLRERMEHAPLSLIEALQVAVQVAGALAAAHAAKIIHRDIKPANIMLRHDGIAKVLDFGLAKFMERLIRQEAAVSFASAPSLVNTQRGTVMGTYKYASPEQLMAQATDERTDVWSLGVVLYEMIAREIPFKGNTAREVEVAVLTEEPLPLGRFSPDVPEELQRIVTKALRKDKEKRYQTIRDMLLDLEALKQRVETEARTGLARGDQGLFIGKNYPYYLMSWKMCARTQSPVFNWPAFIAPIAWMAFRKMYLSLGILLTVGLTFAFLMEMSGSDSSYLGLFVGIGCGLFGNNLYRWHVVRKLRAIKARGLERQQEVAAIRQTGGTSKVMGAIGLVLVLTAIVFNFLYVRHWNEGEQREREARALADEGVKLRRRAITLGLIESESLEGQIMSLQDPIGNRERIRELARGQLEALGQSRAMMLDVMDKFAQADTITTNERLKAQLAVEAQLSNKYVELIDLYRQRAEPLLTLDAKSLDAVAVKRDRLYLRALEVSKELYDLMNNLQKLSQENSASPEAIAVPTPAAPSLARSSPQDAAQLSVRARELDLKANGFAEQARALGKQMGKLNEKRDREQFRRLVRQAADAQAQVVALAREASEAYDQLSKLTVDNKLKEQVSLLSRSRRKWAEATDLRRQMLESFLEDGDVRPKELAARRNRYRQSYQKLEREMKALDVRAQKLAEANAAETDNQFK